MKKQNRSAAQVGSGGGRCRPGATRIGVRNRIVRRRRVPGALALVMAPGLLFASGRPAAKPDGAAGVATAQPSGTLRVFVHANRAGDPPLEEGIEAALREVRDRVQRREKVFRLAESAESADVTLRLTNYRTAQVMRPKLERLILDGTVTLVERSEVIEVHYVDAIVAAGEARESLTGLDERDRGASLRNAASHLVDELERFCEEHCSR